MDLHGGHAPAIRITRVWWCNCQVASWWHLVIRNQGYIFYQLCCTDAPEGILEHLGTIKEQICDFRLYVSSVYVPMSGRVADVNGSTDTKWTLLSNIKRSMSKTIMIQVISFVIWNQDTIYMWADTKWTWTCQCERSEHCLALFKCIGCSVDISLLDESLKCGGATELTGCASRVRWYLGFKVGMQGQSEAEWERLKPLEWSFYYYY